MRNRLLLLSFLLLAAAPSRAQLIDFGPNGEYFVDTTTSLFWIDPEMFQNQGRAAVDTFIASNPNWRWATGAEVDALNGKSAPVGMLLVDVMGASQFTLSNGGPRWVGYSAVTSGVGPGDGWLAQAFQTGGVTIDGTGRQIGVGSWNPGAWVVSSTGPGPMRSLSLTQPQGVGSLRVEVLGQPNENFVTAVSFDNANFSSPGTGWWYGLHITVPDLTTELSFGLPFVGTLDGNGSYVYTLPPSTVGSGLGIHAVTTFFGPAWLNALDDTGVVSLMTL